MLLLGWGTLVVSTGIVTAEMTYGRQVPVTTRTCPQCLTEGDTCPTPIFVAMVVRACQTMPMNDARSIACAIASRRG